MTYLYIIDLFIISNDKPKVETREIMYYVFVGKYKVSITRGKVRRHVYSIYRNVRNT